MNIEPPSFISHGLITLFNTLKTLSELFEPSIKELKAVYTVACQIIRTHIAQNKYYDFNSNPI